MIRRIGMLVAAAAVAAAGLLSTLGASTAPAQAAHHATAAGVPSRAVVLRYDDSSWGG